MPTARDHRAELGVEFVYAGVDRLDYTKGIDQRLRAFKELLDDGQLDPEACCFVQISVPSREGIADYGDERAEVERLVDEINTRHRRSNGSLPVRHITHQLDETDLAAWYRAADCLVVTSYADGMNLVAKEFVAARGDLDASVVLSEFAGAAHDMPGALIVNPYDIDAVKQAMLSSKRMPSSERVERMQEMREAVGRHDVHAWAASFLRRLGRSRLRSVPLPPDPKPSGPIATNLARPENREDRHHRPTVAAGAATGVRRHRGRARRPRPRIGRRRARRAADRPPRLDLPGAPDVDRARRRGPHRWVALWPSSSMRSAPTSSHRTTTSSAITPPPAPSLRWRIRGHRSWRPITTRSAAAARRSTDAPPSGWRSSPSRSHMPPARTCRSLP